MIARLLLAVILTVTLGAPSSHRLTAHGGVSSPRLDRPPELPATIEPTWIYTTALHWKHAPHGIDQSWSFAQVVVLYPEGQYLEIRADLIKRDKDHFVAFSVGDGQLWRAGTWERTDDRVVRVHSRDIWKDDKILNMVHCDANNQNCVTIEQHPIPGPITIDTCGLEGQSQTHLAKTIHCHQMILQPSRLNLDLPELQRMAEHAFGIPEQSGELRPEYRHPRATTEILALPE